MVGGPHAGVRVMEQIVAAFLQLGAVGIMLWWLTLKLIPQMQREQEAMTTMFQREMADERTLHREVNARIMERTDKALDSLLTHIERVH
mgnify:CR=1 FL=1